MRILFGIGKGMVHPVHDGVGFGNQKRRALRSVGKKMEKALPKLVHREHFVRSVAVVEEGLNKNGAKPMPKKKTVNDHTQNLFKPVK